MGLCSFHGKLSCHISPRVTLAHKLVGWRDNNHLLLNVSRRRLGDSGGLQERPPPTPRPLVINGEEVEVVGEYKYLGSIIDCNWVGLVLECLGPPKERATSGCTSSWRSWSLSASAPSCWGCFTGQQWSLRWHSTASVTSAASKNRTRQDSPRSPRLTATRLIGRPVPDLQAHFEEKAVKRLEAIHRDPMHPLCAELQAHTSARSGRLISFRAKTSRFHSSFLPAAVRHCNAWTDRVNWDRPTADRIHVAYCSTTVLFLPPFFFYTYCLNWSNYDFFYLCGYLYVWSGRGEVRQLIWLIGYFVSCAIDAWNFGIEVCYACAVIYMFGEEGG